MHTRFYTFAAILILSTASGCEAKNFRGETKSAQWIMTRSVGGINLNMNKTEINKALSSLGYTVKSTDEKSYLLARGYPEITDPNELCINSGRFAELIIKFEGNNIRSISCVSEDLRPFKNPSNIINDKNHYNGTNIYIYSTDRVFNSYKSLYGLDYCNEEGFSHDFDKYKFCKEFKPSKGPFAYGFSYPAMRFPSKIGYKISLHR